MVFSIVEVYFGLVVFRYCLCVFLSVYILRLLPSGVLPAVEVDVLTKGDIVQFHGLRVNSRGSGTAGGGTVFAKTTNTDLESWLETEPDMQSLELLTKTNREDRASWVVRMVASSQRNALLL